MRKFLALVEREVRERWQLPLGALLLGFLAWAAPWLPRMRAHEPAEVRSGTAVVLSVLLVIGAAMVLGASILARELAEGRLGFYYARPIGGVQLWCGKLTAAVVLLAVAALGVWLPTLAAGGSPAIGLGMLEGPGEVPVFAAPGAWNLRGHLISPAFGADARFWRPAGALGSWFAGGVLLLLLSAHGFSVALRAKNARILLDITAFAALGALAWSSLTRLAANAAAGGVYRLVVAIGWGFLAALFIAGLIQTVSGRTSADRSHVVLSATLWGLLLPYFGILELVSRDLTRIELDELAAVTHLMPAPRGEWLVAAGPLRGGSGYAPVFAYRGDTGERRDLDVLPALASPPVFSSDGNAVAWESCPRDLVSSRGCGVRFLDLERDSTVLDTGISTAPYSERPVARSALALNGDGRRLAVVDQGRLSLYDMPAVGVLAAVELDSADHPGREDSPRYGQPRFVNGRVRVYTAPARDAQLLVRELDAETRRLEDIARLPGIFYRQGRGLLAVWGSGGEIRIFREDDLSAVRVIDREADRLVDDVRFLNDGALIVSERRFAVSSRLRRIDASGEERWSIDVARSTAYLGPELAPGQAWLGVWPTLPGAPIRDREARLLDLETGRVLRSEPGLLPSWHDAAYDSPAARILLDRRGVPNRVEARGDSGEAPVRPLFEISGER